MSKDIRQEVKPAPNCPLFVALVDQIFATKLSAQAGQ